LAGVLVPASTAASAAPQPIATRLAALAADRTSARSIGRAYLRSHLDRAAAAALPAQTLRSLGLDETSALTIGDLELKALVERAIRSDFERYDTEMLDGWVLSRTELQLCALAALGH
jgi:hypothetical protein